MIGLGSDKNKKTIFECILDVSLFRNATKKGAGAQVYAELVLSASAQRAALTLV